MSDFPHDQTIQEPSKADSNGQTHAPPGGLELFTIARGDVFPFLPVVLLLVDTISLGYIDHCQRITTP